MFAALLIATLMAPAQRLDNPPFTGGRFTVEQRVAANPNPYLGTQLEFIDGGVLLWIRNGSAYAMMEWKVDGDTFTINDGERCPVAPTGTYRVRWSERGWVFDRISDDCAERVASAETMLLVPVKSR